MLYRNMDGIPRETVMHVAQRLHESGVKQKDVAELLGCSQATVSAWLKEVRYQPSQVDQNAVATVTRSLMASRIDKGQSKWES